MNDFENENFQEINELSENDFIDFRRYPSSNPNSNQNVIHVTNARIEDITFQQGTTFVTIEYGGCPNCNTPNQRVALIVSRNTIIRDERGNSIPIRELQIGMNVNASFSSAMTRSIPPQAQAFQIHVISRPRMREETIGRIIEVNTRNQFILTISNNNPSSIIRFNVSPDTAILDSFNRRIPLSRLFPGLRVRVEHASFMTASIPPQTAAFVIQVLR